MDDTIRYVGAFVVGVYVGSTVTVLWMNWKLRRTK
jgi:hypothetical protein